MGKLRKVTNRDFKIFINKSEVLDEQKMASLSILTSSMSGRGIDKDTVKNINQQDQRNITKPKK